MDDVIGEESSAGWRTEEGVGLRGFCRPRCTNGWADGMGVGNHGLGTRLSEMWGNVTPRIRCARCLPVIRRPCLVICLRVAFFHVIICISYHVIMCFAFAYVFVSCIRAFSPLSVLQSGAPISSGAPLSFSFVCECQTFSEWTEACQVASIYHPETTGQVSFHLEVVWYSNG